MQKKRKPRIKKFLTKKIGRKYNLKFMKKYFNSILQEFYSEFQQNPNFTNFEAITILKIRTDQWYEFFRNDIEGNFSDLFPAIDL
jgi:hypothetical protein